MKQTPDQCFKKLSEALKKRASSLQDLDITFVQDLEIPEQSYRNLNKGLKTLLRRLRLNFQSAGVQVKNHCVKQLFENFQGLQSLHSVDLNFQTFKATVKILFIFDSCKRIINGGVRKMMEALEKSTSLRIFKLDLRGCKKLTDTSLKIISSTLIKFPSLQSIDLHLVRGHRVTDVGYKSLIGALETLQYLSFLKIDFRQ